MSLGTPAVVMDNGTGLTKLGFAGNDSPSFIFPTAIATSSASSKANKTTIRSSNLSSKRGLEDLDFYIGDEAIDAASGPQYGLHYPIRHGQIEDWDQMERF